jgi:hypothetical protein
MVIKLKWESKDVCEECLHELTDDDIIFSDDICPYCGHDSTNSEGTKKVKFQRIFEFTWSELFNPFITVTYKTKDEFSKKWVELWKQK